MGKAPQGGGGGVSRRIALVLPALAVGAAPGARAAQSGRKPQLAIADRVAIEDLHTAFLWAFDCSDEAGFVELFAEGGMVIGLGRPYATEQAMREWFQGLLRLRDNGGEVWLHEAGQFRFEGDGRRCVVYAYATHFKGNPTSRESGVRSLGYYVNECVKISGQWKFSRLSINRWDNHAQPWKKKKPWEALEHG